MASNTAGKTCVKCDKGMAQTLCVGCQQLLCFKHLLEHRQELNKQLEDLGQYHDEIRHNLMKTDHDQHPLVTRIDAWEVRSINRIQQVAKEVRHELKDYLKRINADLQKSLSEVSNQMQMNRQAERFSEIELNHWMTQLHVLRQKLDKPSGIEILHDQMLSSSKIPLIVLKVGENSTPSSRLDISTRWKPNGVTIAGGHSYGNALNQLSCPFGLDVNDDGTLFIADCENHRIVQWKPGAREGKILFGGTGRGERLDQLHHPLSILIDRTNGSMIIGDYGNSRVLRVFYQNSSHAEILVSNIRTFGLSMDDEGFLYISDYDKHEVRRFHEGDRVGTVVAGGNGRGRQLDQLNCPRNIFLDSHGSLYISDTSNHRIVKWPKGAKRGILVAGGQDPANSPSSLSSPSGLFIDAKKSVYIVDQRNHRVMRWLPDAQEGTLVVGGNDAGSKPNQLNLPTSLFFHRNRDLYVVDRDNHRIQCFSVE